jgi:hypothetical protein
MKKLITVLCFFSILHVGFAEDQHKRELSVKDRVVEELHDLMIADEFTKNERDRLLAIGTNAIEPLVSCLYTNETRCYIIGALGLLELVIDKCQSSHDQEKAAFAAIQGHLDSKDYYVRLCAVGALSSIKQVDVVPSVLPFLEDKHVGVRIVAARALAVRGDRTTVTKIEDILKRRASGLSPEKIAKDGSFKEAQKAIAAILDREKGTRK